MRVLIITEEDVFYIHGFFRMFFPLSRGAPYTVTAVTILPPFNKRSLTDLAAQMYGFYGPVRFVQMGTLYAWRRAWGISVRGLCRRHGVDLLETQRVNDPAYIAEVKRRAIDIIVSVAAPQIFKDELIGAARYGCINSHSSLLPENRGMMPVFWGLFKGDTEIGVTVHAIDGSIDTGPILRQERVPVAHESLHEMILKTKRISVRLIDEVLRDFAAGKATAAPMPAGGSYQTFPTAADMREFRRRGKRLF